MRSKQLNGELLMKWCDSIVKFLLKIKPDSSEYRRSETEKEAEQILAEPPEEF